MAKVIFESTVVQSAPNKPNSILCHNPVQFNKLFSLSKQNYISLDCVKSWEFVFLMLSMICWLENIFELTGSSYYFYKWIPLFSIIKVIVRVSIRVRVMIHVRFRVTSRWGILQLFQKHPLPLPTPFSKNRERHMKMKEETTYQHCTRCRSGRNPSLQYEHLTQIWSGSMWLHWCKTWAKIFQ